jgi:hypothetical protein
MIIGAAGVTWPPVNRVVRIWLGRVRISRRSSRTGVRSPRQACPHKGLRDVGVPQPVTYTRKELTIRLLTGRCELCK